MRDLYNLHKFYNNEKSSKQLNNRRKSFGYQVLGFGSGVSAGVDNSIVWGGDRGVFAGGDDPSGGRVNVIEYITISTTGNVTDFGDLSTLRVNMGGLSSGSRGVWGAGNLSGTEYNIMEYITFASLGNVTDFGDLTAVRRQCGGVSNGTRGCFAGGKYG